MGFTEKKGKINNNQKILKNANILHIQYTNYSSYTIIMYYILLYSVIGTELRSNSQGQLASGPPNTSTTPQGSSLSGKMREREREKQHYF